MKIPEHFSSLREFSEWYVNNNYPFCPPKNIEVFETDDAITFCLFRSGRYQVELYILDNPLDISEHAHPGLDIILCPGVNGIGDSLWGNLSSTLVSGQSHAGGSEDPTKPYNKLLLAFSKWPSSVTPFTSAAVWKGKLIGPKHEKLIRRFFPNALIKDGFVDTSVYIELNEKNL